MYDSIEIYDNTNISLKKKDRSSCHNRRFNSLMSNTSTNTFLTFSSSINKFNNFISKNTKGNSIQIMPEIIIEKKRDEIKNIKNTYEKIFNLCRFKFDISKCKFFPIHVNKIHPIELKQISIKKSYMSELDQLSKQYSDKSSNNSNRFNISIDKSIHRDKILCKNISSNLAKLLNLSMNEISPSISKEYHPPKKHGLDNSERIFGDYYLTNIDLNGKIFEIDYFNTIIDDVRNMRKLNRFQKLYIKNMTEEYKNILIDEYITNMENIIEYMENIDRNV